MEWGGLIPRENEFNREWMRAQFKAINAYGKLFWSYLRKKP